LARLQGAISDISRELDFRRRVASDGRDEVSLTAGDFDRLTTRLQHSLQSLQSGIVQVSTASQHLQDASQQVASSASQQSHASAQMAAAVEEMTVSLSHVADRANEAQALSAAGAQQASAGEQAIEQVVSDIGTIASTVSDTATQMTVLAERSQNIASVVSVIRDVADQTNLLALNAAIEAARAGESGRGFAVVADEVRKLAERTAASTQEIGQIIQAIQQVSGNVVTQMDQAVTQVARGQQGVASARVNMQQLLDGARQSAQLVAEISNAILEQSAATQSIARQVEQVAQGAESNSEAAGRAAGLADTLGSVALQMREEANRYRV
jgi:methyl-accepting chemotaxis protein